MTGWRSLYFTSLLQHSSPITSVSFQNISNLTPPGAVLRVLGTDWKKRKAKTGCCQLMDELGQVSLTWTWMDSEQ